MTRPVVLLAGGGTGGHVVPMIAVADALRAEADVRVVFVGTARGIESRLLGERGDELELLDVLPIKGRGVVGAMRGLVRAALTLPEARSLVRRLDPRVVLSVGGYASGPAGIAGWSLRVPVAILAPDLVLGLANRWLAPFARRAYVSFSETESKLPRGIAIRTGVPLRGAFRPSPYVPTSERFRVLVVGGSSGAKALNDEVPRALAEVARQVPSLSILHQVGRDREKEVAQAYEQLGLTAQAVVTPFIEDVASELAGADLFIGRAGAGAIAELCAVGRPSILVPLPNVGVHQRENAEALAARGATVCLAQSELAARLSTEVLALVQSDERRVKLADAARELGRPQAAREIARDLLELAGIARRPGPTGVSPASEAANGYTAGRGRTHQAGAAHV